MKTPSWQRRALAAEKTAETLKQKVVSLYRGGSKSVIQKQLERSKQREAADQRRRELLEVRQQEMARYTSVLEGQVEERTRAIRTILDNVTFGFLLVGRGLEVLPGFTASCSGLFGCNVVDGASLAVLLETDERVSCTLEALVDQIFEDILPEEVALDQLPRRFDVRGRVLSLEAKAVRSVDGEVESLLVSVSDISALESAQRQAQRNGAIIAILSKKAAFTRFIADARAMLDEARGSEDAVLQRRHLHTVKGNAASWGLIEVAELVHRIEEHDEIRREHIESVHAEFARFLDETHGVLGLSYEAAPESSCSIKRSKVRELRRILDEIDDEVHVNELRRWAAAIDLCPADELLGPLEAFVGRLAARLGKDVDVTVVGADTLVEPERMGPVFRNLTHLLRNAVDHGIEPPEDRLGKPPRGHIEIEISSGEDTFEIAVTDDGRGIDTDRLGREAVSRGVVSEAELGVMTREQRLELVFLDGISSAEVATDISGRGVGMAAIRGAVRTCGGQLSVQSHPGQGTRFSVRVPKSTAVRSAA